MKVKILKATHNTYWYSDQIGKIFEVAENCEHNEDYVLDEDYNNKDSDKIPWRHLAKSDCIIVDKLEK